MNQSTVLRVEQLRVSRGRRKVLTDVSFHAFAGELVGILGPNGSGKSTLLEAMIAALPVEHGSIEVLGRPLTSLLPRQRAQCLAYLGQSEQVPRGLDVHQFVALGRLPHRSALDHDHPDDEAAIERALCATETKSLARRAVTDLSSGERARVALARVLAQGSPILLLDEPTAHLDLGHRLDLMSLARTLAHRGYTLLMVLHDLDLAARYCDRAIILHDGRTSHVGPIETVLCSDVLREVFGVAATLRSRQGQVIGLDIDRSSSVLPTVNGAC